MRPLALAVLYAAACSRNSTTAETKADAVAEGDPLVAPGVPRSADAVVRGYLGYADCKEEANYIIDGKVNGPIMLARYADMKITNCGPWSITKVEGSGTDNCATAAINEHCFLNVSFADAPLLETDLVKTPSGFLIDWRSTIAYNPMTFAAFKAVRPKTPTILRSWVSLGNLYGVPAFPESRFYALKLRENKTSEMLWGYLRRDGNGKTFDALKDGKEHPIMLQVLHHDDVSNDNVEITKVVDLTWRQNAAEFPAH